VTITQSPAVSGAMAAPISAGEAWSITSISGTTSALAPAASITSTSAPA
jgi:hypothetical protein